MSSGVDMSTQVSHTYRFDKCATPMCIYPCYRFALISMHGTDIFNPAGLPWHSGPLDPLPILRKSQSEQWFTWRWLQGGLVVALPEGQGPTQGSYRRSRPSQSCLCTCRRGMLRTNLFVPNSSLRWHKFAQDRLAGDDQLQLYSFDQDLISRRWQDKKKYPVRRHNGSL